MFCYVGDALFRGFASDVAVRLGRWGIVMAERKMLCNVTVRGECDQVGLLNHDHPKDRFPPLAHLHKAFNSVFCPRFRTNRMLRAIV